MHLRSKSTWPLMAAGLFVMTAVVVSGWAQQPAATPPAKQQPAAKQPSLTVDRDPVPSPDVDAPAQSQTGTTQGVGLGKIEREGGQVHAAAGCV